MSEARLSVHDVEQQGSPLPITDIENNNWLRVRKRVEEIRARTAIESRIACALDRGNPVALYDDELNRPYLQYPDGRRVYDIINV